MAPSKNFHRRIGAVFLPQAEAVDVPDDSGDALTSLLAKIQPPVGPTPGPSLPLRLCRTKLKQGCYTLSFIPSPATIFSTRYRGTLRVEQQPSGRMVFSGDLYGYRLFDHVLHPVAFGDEAADTGGAIPIYSRRSYFAYLKGTGAQMSSIVPLGKPCTFSLNLDQFNYNHPATGFSGSFNTAPTRSIRFDFSTTATAGLYNGTAYLGSTAIGSVSIRWISDMYRKATVNLHTLKGAVSPPANVGGTTMADIFADVGWGITFNDLGQINLPSTLTGTTITDCWPEAKLHTLMESVPGYNPAALDSSWDVQLVAVPAKLGCGRGVMFDSSLGADPNHVPREGSGTFSHDGYPANEVPNGMGGSFYDGAANKQQKDVPRAFLRSATHEIGHAFNQIHQNFEGGIDNSIMSPTPSVATVLGNSGTFPNDIALRFNDRVKGHLRHLPDPAVRPGAMDFFGSAISAPQASDVAWLDGLELSVETDVDRVALGQPVQLSWTVTNTGALAIPAPTKLDVESLLARVSVTDPLGNVTFMRTPRIRSCPHIDITELEPGASIEGSTTLYWGTDGFAFELPGHHVVEVIALWDAQGTPIGASGETHVFVTYPHGDDSEVAALLLHPDVGRAVATGSLHGKAEERIARAQELSGEHAATAALQRIGIAEKPKRPGRAKRKK